MSPHGSEAFALFVGKLQSHKGPISTSEIAEVIGLLENCLVGADADPLVIEKLASALVLDRIPAVFQVAILRTSYPFRDRLTGWRAFRDRIRAFLNTHNLNGTQVLRGLFD